MLGQLHRRGGRRHRTLADGRAVAHELARLERAAEQPAHDLAHRAGLLGSRERASYLSDDLGLPQHERVERGYDAEEVLHRCRPLLHDERPAERLRIVRAHARQRAEPLDDGAHAVGRGDGGRVHLGAVARGEHHGFGHRVVREQRGQLDAQAFGRNGQFAAQLDGSGLVAHAHGQKRHRGSPPSAPSARAAATATASA